MEIYRFVHSTAQFQLHFDRKKAESRFTSYRIWTRLVICGAVMIIGYFVSGRDKERKFALRKESIIFRSQNVDCSPEYLSELLEFKSCMPNKCGRFVSDSIVVDKEVKILLDLAKTGLSFGGGSGGASILDLHSGALSQDESFVNIYKLPEAKGFLNEEALAAYRHVRRKIAQSICDKFAIDPNSLHLTHPTFFSRIDNGTAKTIHDEYWHPHVDKETYSSFHYTSLLYLSDYQRDFHGGRFIFVDENKAENKTLYSSIEPKRGRVSVFTSGAENLHHIEKVTEGTRYAITISFTCNKKFAITDPMEEQ